MKLKAVYKSVDEIPEQFRELYTDVKGQFELTEVEGVKTVEDVKRLTEALTAERKLHKETKEKYVVPWGDRDPAVELPRLDALPELEATVKSLKENSKFDETKMEAIINARVQSIRDPLDRALKKTGQELEAARAQVANYDRAEKVRKIHDVVREVATKANFTKEAYSTADSALMLLAERHLEVNSDGHVVTREGSGVIAGLLPDVWISEVGDRHPYLKPASSGGGASGSGGLGSHTGPNPFSKEHSNLTEAGKIIKENPQKAEQLRKLAGPSGPFYNMKIGQ